MAKNEKSGPGRKPVTFTARQRDDVRLFAAAGLAEASIAAALNVSVGTLRKCCKEEIACGRSFKRAANLKRLEEAAAAGSVSAMKALQVIFDRAESKQTLDGESETKRQERLEAAVRQRMSKRQLEQRDALTAGQNTDWGDDLKPSLNWRQH
jgi:hypothetical protein